jgi:serine/threonine protein kinase
MRLRKCLSSPARREDPHNYAVPILDCFTKGEYAFLVMPLLRPFDDPPFATVAEVVDFVRQMLQVSSGFVCNVRSNLYVNRKQGIKHLHDLNAAHR